MVKISQAVKKHMEELNLLKVEKGRVRGLHVCNKDHKSRAKSFFVQDDIYASYLRKTKTK